MGVEVETDKELVSRILREKTRDGPGDVLKVIVYVYGFTPFTIPQKWIKGDDQKVAEFKVARVQKRVAQRTMTFGGHLLEVIEMDAVDDSGTAVVATASAGITPIGALALDTPDVGMSWRTGAWEPRRGSSASPRASSCG